MIAASLLIIFNLFVLESLLSIDNAAVLAVMVKDLPEAQKRKAFLAGVWGAIILRGVCLFFFSYLISMWGLKIVGGAYLVYLLIKYWLECLESEEPKDSNAPSKPSKLFQLTDKLGLNQFWTTVVLIEIMDLSFSVDNIFAAVALSSNFYIIMAGVIIGILSIRLIASWFVKLIDKYPILNTSAFIVIGLLGLKLIFSGAADGFPEQLVAVKFIMSNKHFDIGFSVIMMLIFFVPVLISKLTIPSKSHGQHV